MAAAGVQPFLHVQDSNGVPIVGARLYVYDAGTTTLKTIYPNADLTGTLANPLTSDASGDFSRFYLATGTYKVRAQTSTGTLIWEYDNVDTGLPAGTGALPISGGGTGATTAAAARTNLDVPSNSELTTLSNTISALQTSIQSIVSAPQGRLTLTSGVPVITTGVTAGTAVYYTPYVGNLCPIYDGSQFNARAFSELTLTLNANHTANSIYDVFIFYQSSTVTIGTGPGWNTATAGSGARGSGTGTTELARKNGLWTNKNAMTVRNGATTYTVPANQGTFVGSIDMDGSNGQVTTHTTYGQSRKCGISNAYNRKKVILLGGDTTTSWAPGVVGPRASNNATDNSLTLFSCLPEEYFNIKFMQKIIGSGGVDVATIGIGVNVTNAFSGTTPKVDLASVVPIAVASHVVLPAIGRQTITALEQSNGSSTAFYGGTDDMVLMAEWDA